MGSNKTHLNSAPPSDVSNEHPINSTYQVIDGWLTRELVKMAPNKIGPAFFKGIEFMFLVNVSILSDQNVHCMYEKHLVNDPELASKWRLTLQSKFHAYANNEAFIKLGVVTPCTTANWKKAMVRLRKKNPGQYFLPVFPPPKTGIAK